MSTNVSDENEQGASRGAAICPRTNPQSYGCWNIPTQGEVSPMTENVISNMSGAIALVGGDDFAVQAGLRGNGPRRPRIYAGFGRRPRRRCLCCLPRRRRGRTRRLSKRIAPACGLNGVRHFNIRQTVEEYTNQRGRERRSADGAGLGARERRSFAEADLYIARMLTAGISQDQNGHSRP